jgi:hypothetical protein
MGEPSLVNIEEKAFERPVVPVWELRPEGRTRVSSL